MQKNIFLGIILSWVISVFSIPTEIASPIFIAEGKVLVLAPRKENFLGNRYYDKQGIFLEGLEVPGNVNDFKRRLESCFLRKPITKHDILKIKKSIICYYKKHHRPLVMVYVPKQDISQGILKLVVVESHLGMLDVQGNQWFSSQEIKEWISIYPNDVINQAILQRNLALLNRNPFRDVSAVYVPGKKEGTTDILLQVQDRRPLRFYAGTENNGLPLIGRKRWFVGMHWGKVFNRADLFSYQFISSYDIDDFIAHTAQYSITFPWQHILELYGGYSKTHAHLPVWASTPPNGESIQASMRYYIPLSPSQISLHDLYFGADYKRTNTNIEYSNELPLFGDNVNVFQIMMGWDANSDLSWLKSSVDLEVFWSPGRWLKDQKASDFASLRSLAKNYYFYGTAKMVNLFTLPKDFSFSTLLKGQLSSTNLIPSEQFGLGGYNTVRGYEERAANGEHGLLFSMELRSPSYKLFPRSTHVMDYLQILGFLDSGFTVLDRKGETGVRKWDFLIGSGPGLRYVVSPYLSLRLDFGFKLHKKDFFGGSVMTHFSVNGGF